MKYLDLTCATPAENLACDEALLEASEEGGLEMLRFWESPRHFVVLGYANRVRQEVNLEACHGREVPVLRRCSGGGTVLQGPGCLNYSLVLKMDRAVVLGSITETNCYIMKQHAQALQSRLGRSVQVAGFTDLALDGLKFSGNAQRRKRHSILFHGTFLLEFDRAVMEELLLPPPKEPAYRQHRAHSEFLTTLALSRRNVKAALREAWQSSEPLLEIPRDRIAELVAEKYSREEWNLKW